MNAIAEAPLTGCLNVLLVEDEREILTDMQYEMEQSLNKLESDVLNDNMVSSELFTPMIKHKLNATDNLEQARDAVHAGNCDVLVTDYKIKERAESLKATASIIPLLQEIKMRNAFIPVAGHTAYHDLLETASGNDLAIKTFSKAQHDSTKQVLDIGYELSKLMFAYKHCLYQSFEELRRATVMESPIDRQTSLEHARVMFAELKPPTCAPADYRKALIVVRSVVMRISSVPSKRFKLGELSAEFIDIMTPLVRELGRPFFSFNKHAVPVLLKLEGTGYNVIMRIDDGE